MSTKQRFLTVYIVVMLLLVATGVAAYYMAKIQLDLKKEQQIRLASYELSNYLKKSSDDLTRFARIYTVTGDLKSRRKYEEIIEIFDGKQTAIDGKSLSITERLDLLKFSEGERKKLLEAKQTSADLAVIEQNAFKTLESTDYDPEAHEGKSRKEYLVNVMFGGEYRSYKDKINGLSKEFVEMVTKRNDEDITKLENKTKQTLIVLLSLLAIVIFIVIYSFILISRKIVRDNI